MTRSLCTLLAAAAVAACGPNLTNLSCASSTECPTGYACNLSTGKCEAGDSKPEITALTDVSGVTFNGAIAVRARVVDPSGIASVTVQLGSAAAVTAAETAAGTGIFKASIDTTTAFGGQDVTVDAVITAKNNKGATSTATLSGLHIDNKGPVIGAVSVGPAGAIFPGEVVTIGVDVGESLADAPVVTVSPPSGPSRAASLLTQGAATHFNYQFATLHGDPAGSWTISVTAHDALHNSTTGGSGSFTLHADVSPAVQVTAPATALKQNATTTVTATFSEPVTALPTVSLAGSAQTVTRLSGNVGDAVFTYSVSASNAGEEGAHLFTATGTTVSGDSVSGTLTIVFDYTAPTFALFVSGNYPTGPNTLPAVNKAMPNNLQFAAPNSEPLGSATSVSAVLSNNINSTTSAVAPDGTFTQTPTFSVPFANLTEGAINTLTVKICDAAGNCTTHAASVDVFTGDAPTVTIGAPTFYKVGDTVAVQVALTQPALDPNAFVVQMSQLTGGTNTFALSPTACAGCPANTYAFAGSVPASATNGTYGASATGSDVYGNQFNGVTSGTTNTVTLKTSVPVLSTVTNPNWVPRSASVNFVVGFTSADSFTTTGTTTAACLDPGPTDPDPCIAGTPIPATNISLSAAQAQIAWTAPATASVVQHYLRVTYTDQAGNKDTRFLPFTYDGIFAALNSATYSRTTALGPNEPISITFNLNKGSILAAGVASTSTNATVSHGTPAVGVNGTQWTVGYTMPAACNGGAGTPASGVPFNVGITVNDVAGNPQQALNVSLVCNAAPTIGTFSWDKTAGTPGTTLNLTVSVNELLLGATQFTLSSGAVAVGTPSLVNPGVSGTVSPIYKIPVTLSSPCNGASGPADASPLALSLTAKDSFGDLSSPVAVGAVTCNIPKTATASTPVASFFRLQQSPYDDGTVRSYVSASAGAINPTGTAASRIGLFLYACPSAPCSAANALGSAAVNTNDGSVFPFQVGGSPGPTQVILQILDSAGTTPVSVTGYTNEVDLGFQGRDKTAINPASAYDATGTDATIPPEAWIADGGAGPLAQIAPCNVQPPPPLPADAGYSPASYCALADDDYNFASVTTANGSPATQPMAWHALNPLSGAVTPPARVYAGSTMHNGSLTVYGGLSGFVSLTSDAAGALWSFNPNGGGNGLVLLPNWTPLTIGTGGANPPQMWGTMLASDNQNFWLFGGATGGTLSAPSYTSNIYFTKNTFGAGTETFTWNLATNDVMPFNMTYGSAASTSFFFYPIPGAVGAGSTQYAFLFGGLGASTDNCRIYLFNTTVPGSTSHFLTCNGGPPGRMGSAVFFGGVPGSQSFYVFGGTNAPLANTLFNDLWQYSVNGSNQATWTQLSPNGATGAPSPRQGAMGWVDQGTGHVFIYGGTPNVNAYVSTVNPAGDLWEWNGSAWSQVIAPLGAYAPLPRSYGALGAYSLCDQGTTSCTPRSEALVSTGAITTTTLNDTWFTGRESVNRLLMKFPLSTISNFAAITPANLTVQLRAQNVLQGTRPWIWDGNGWRALEILVPGPAGNTGTTIDISQALAPVSGAGAIIQGPVPNNAVYVMFDAQGTAIAPPVPQPQGIVPSADSVALTLTWH